MLRIGRISTINKYTAWIYNSEYNILVRMTHNHKPGDLVIYWLESGKYKNNVRFAPFSINVHYTICIFLSIFTWIKSSNFIR